jgi:HEPN domain-containing protein
MNKTVMEWLNFSRRDLVAAETHNIKELLENLGEVDKNLAKSISEAGDLTDFATKYRYPEAIIKDLSRKDIETAVAVAKSVCEKILKRLSS